MYIDMEMLETQRNNRSRNLLGNGTSFIKIPVKSVGRFFLNLYFLLFLCFACGCNNKFLDPTQIGRFRPVPSVNVILDSLGVAEETPVAWEDAEEPRPIDTVVTGQDYALRSGDVVRIAIFELLQENIQFVNDYIVTEAGKVSIPDVGVVEASGLTETQLEEEIKRILSPSILKNPSVSVTLIGSQQRTFSVLGEGVPASGRFVIPRYGFRLTDALAMAGGPKQFNVSYIYVSRFIEDKEKRPGIINPGFGELDLSSKSNQKIPRETTAKVISNQWPKSNVVIASSEMATEEESVLMPNGFDRFRGNNPGLTNNRNTTISQTTSDDTREPASVEEVLKVLSERSKPGYTYNESEENETVDSQPQSTIQTEGIAEQQQRFENTNRNPVRETIPEQPVNQSQQDTANRIEWTFKDGQWVPVQVGAATSVQQEQGHIEWVYRDGKWVPIQVGTVEPVQPKIEVEPDQRLITNGKKPIVPESELEQEDMTTRLIRIPIEKLLSGDPRYNIVIKPGDTVFVPVDLVGEFYIGGNVNHTGTIPLTGRPITLKQAIVAAGGLGPLAWPKRCEVVRRIGRKKEEIVMVDLDKIARGEQPDFFIKPNDLINVGTHATSRWRAILRNAFRATYGFGFVYDRNFADRDFGTHRPIPAGWF